MQGRKAPAPLQHGKSACSRLVGHFAKGCTRGNDSTAPRSPTFPIEIWGLICPYLDIRTLWISCCPVSTALREEVEREIKKIRLPQLRLRWRFSSQYLPGDFKTPYEHLGRLGLYKLEQLSHFSEDGQRVCFDVVFELHDPCNTQDPYEVPPSRLSDIQLTAIKRSLLYKDCGQEGSYIAIENRSLVLCGIVGEVELPGCEIDLHAGHMSFLWKLFLTDFLMGNALERVWNRRRVAFEKQK